MSLADFMKQLQDQDITFSEVPEQPVRVIPPEQTTVRVIVPEIPQVNKPTKIKLNLTPPSSTPAVPRPVAQPVQPVAPRPVVPQPVATPQPVQQPVVSTPVKPTQTVVSTGSMTQLTDEELFIKSGTEDSKKAIWFEYLEKARTSTKKNQIVDKMKIGRFTITPDNKFLILPDYDVVGKDPDDILKDSWF